MSIDIDARALALLDTLMEAAPGERAAALAKLGADEPLVHARLLRLLKASEALDDSLLLARPVAAELERVGAVLRPGALFAGYRLQRELGRGGMSVVWLAERADGVVKRPVAIKLPLITLAPSILGERFARERDVLAGLTHPNIARLYDAGVAENGQPFIALEFVDGQPIAEFCDRQALSIDARLQLFQQVIAAVGHAHTHLVVHRDLKPSNILVDTSGQVKLLDFGIAKLLGEDSSAATQLTQQGGCALTPRYAAPEQISNAPISTVTDVYALGVVLYELLTGLPPYAASEASVGGVTYAVLNTDALRPSHAAFDDTAAQARGLAGVRKLSAALAGDLDTIVLKALRKAPAERYNSVERFGDDLQRYLSRQPIAARPPSWMYRTKLFVHRHRAVTLATGLGAAAALFFGAVALQQHRESSLQAARAAAVSGFLSDLVSDAEPDETRPNAEVTGKDMVDAAVARARLQFHDRPQLEGELLGELGRMYFRLGDHDKSVKTLGEALALLERHAPAGDPALNKVRAHLAGQLIAEDKADEARTLATLALNSCIGKDRECAKARAYARQALATVENDHGHAEEALIHARQTVREMERAFSVGDANIVDALESLAVLSRNTGHLQEAREALERALLLGQHQALRASDRSRMLLTRALLELDLGHFDAARSQFEALLPRSSNSDEQMMQQRLLSNTLAAQGMAAEAKQAAEKALSRPSAEDANLAVVFVKQAHAVALALLGSRRLAQQEIEAVVDALTKLGYGADTLVMLRAHRLQGELLLRAGELAPARAELESAAQRLTRTIEKNAGTPSLELELAQVLDLLGCLHREAGDAKGALLMHEKARSRFEKNLPPDHPFLARNTLYQEVATVRMQGQIANRELLMRQAADYKARFPTGSVWRLMLDRSLDASLCSAPASPGCILVL